MGVVWCVVENPKEKECSVTARAVVAVVCLIASCECAQTLFIPNQKWRNTPESHGEIFMFILESLSYSECS